MLTCSTDQRAPYLFDKTDAYCLVLRGLTMTLTAYIMYNHMYILLLGIELRFLTLHEVSFICSFQVPQYNYFSNFNVILIETSVSRKLTILCIMFKIMAFFIITLFAGLYYMRGFTHMWKTLT
jgi:hypothetical protein